MQSNVIIEDRVNAARAESVGDRPKDQHPESAAERKSEQRARRHNDAHRRHLARAESMQELIAEETREDRSDKDRRRDQPRVGKRHLDLGMQDGPRRPEKRIGQTEADEADVYKR